MQFGKRLNSCEIKVGDVVRIVPGYPDPQVGGPEDFRHGYDAMTAVKIHGDFVDFRRPYLHVDDDGSLSCLGFEEVSNVPRRANRFYEKLNH